jgi:hypothetical protein
LSWRKPTKTAAKGFGLSEGGLAKSAKTVGKPERKLAGNDNRRFVVSKIGGAFRLLLRLFITRGVVGHVGSPLIEVLNV